jgi:uncharacterized membrane protein YkoI
MAVSGTGSWRRRLAAALAVAVALGAAGAAAQPPRAAGWSYRQVAERQQERRPRVTLEEAMERVRRQTGGRILSGRTVERDGRTVHRIKVLTPERKVRAIYVDAGGKAR